MYRQIKEHSTVESLDRLGHPSISFHGSFSMMVNFDAIGRYFKNSGGDSFLQTSRKGIKTFRLYLQADSRFLKFLKQQQQ